MKGLTKRQREIINYIQEFIANNRYSPSYREIGAHFGFSSLASVYKHILALKRKGQLQLKKQSSRSMTLVEEQPLAETSETTVPFIGHLFAGQPLKLFSQPQEIAVPRSLVHAPEKTYVLRAQGDGLIEDLIAEGDLLIVEARLEAHPGETVIALVNQHDTIVKRYHPDGEYVKLAGSLPHQHPILLRAEDVLIQGVVVGLLRHFG